MRITPYLVALFAVVAASAMQPAQSQPAPGYRGQAIECSSNDMRRHYCNVPWGDARIVQQISGSACVRGQTWGFARGGIWVDQGCRARFAPVADRGDGGGRQAPRGWDRRFRMSCSSSGYDYQMCRVDVGRRGHVTLRRQTSSSACIEGQTWGFNRAGIWVNRGCAGDFVVDRRW